MKNCDRSETPQTFILGPPLDARLCSAQTPPRQPSQSSRFDEFPVDGQRSKAGGGGSTGGVGSPGGRGLIEWWQRGEILRIEEEEELSSLIERATRSKEIHPSY